MKSQMQVRLDYTTQEQLERNIEILKKHFEVLEVSKEYSSSKRNRAYVRYNLRNE